MAKIYYILGSKSDSEIFDKVKGAIAKAGIEYELKGASHRRNKLPET